MASQNMRSDDFMREDTRFILVCVGTAGRARQQESRTTFTIKTDWTRTMTGPIVFSP